MGSEGKTFVWYIITLVSALLRFGLFLIMLVSIAVFTWVIFVLFSGFIHLSMLGLCFIALSMAILLRDELREQLDRGLWSVKRNYLLARLSKAGTFASECTYARKLVKSTNRSPFLMRLMRKSQWSERRPALIFFNADNDKVIYEWKRSTILSLEDNDWVDGYGRQYDVVVLGNALTEKDRDATHLQ